MKTISFLIVIFLSIISSFAFSKELPTYRISWFPENDENCPNKAQAIAAKFTAATGFNVVVARCERPFSWRQDIVIQYQADVPAKLVSTYAEFVSDQGAYSNRESCEADLTNERELFESKTGLVAVTAFCFPDTLYSSNELYPYVARIDGFGSPSLLPLVFDMTFYGGPRDSPDALKQLLTESLKEIPSVEEPRLTLDFKKVLPHAIIKYYARRQQPLSFSSVISFASFKDCHLGQNGMDALLEEFGLQAGKSFCTREQFSDVTTLYHFGLSTGAYSVETIPGSFEGSEECNSALPDIVSRYANSTGSFLVKGFCSYERLGVWANYTYLAKILVAN